MRKHTRRRAITPVPPRGLRPRLAGHQVQDLELVHLANLDAIARGCGTEELLWQVVGGTLTWGRVAQRLGLGEPEMRAQTELVTALVQRYGRTGRVGFTGAEYQLAKQGVDVMDQLARTVDRATAVEAAEWSEARVQAMANAPASAHLFPTAPAITEADVPY
jgi:hypothetical protein